VTSSWEYWSLAYVSPVRMSPARPPLEPATAWEEIDKPPSVISVQFAPRLPFARLKSSAPAVAEAPCGNATWGNTRSGTRSEQKINNLKTE
jgi:hypothetical protein